MRWLAGLTLALSAGCSAALAATVETDYGVVRATTLAEGMPAAFVFEGAAPRVGAAT